MAPRTTSTERLPVFDLFRASAALLVFLFHYASFTSARTMGTPWVDVLEWFAAGLGSNGTNLLLLLSGYFSARSMSSERFRYARFVSLRLVRIYVPFLAVLFLALAFNHLFPTYARVHPGTLSWQQIAGNLLLWPGLFAHAPILTVTWTLSYIVAGYILLPLVAVASKRVLARRQTRFIAWGGAAIACFLCGLADLVMIRLTYIPLGCLIWELQASAREPAASSTRTLLLGLSVATAAAGLLLRLTLAGAVAEAAPAVPPLLLRGLFVASGLLTVSATLAAGLLLQHSGAGWQQRRSVRCLAQLGQAGYSFYLLHGPIIKVFSLTIFPILATHALPAAAYWTIMPVCLALSTAAAALLYRFVEIPCRNQFLSAKALKPAAAQPVAPPPGAAPISDTGRLAQALLRFAPQAQPFPTPHRTSRTPACSDEPATAVPVPSHTEFTSPT